jgi:hypothetical chaperone protein
MPGSAHLSDLPRVIRCAFPDEKAMTFCAIDFGTSNSAIALPAHDAPGNVRLVEVEGHYTTLPTAVFFNVDEGRKEYGREALRAYIDGFDGRLMRSMKSILGTSLADQTTDPGDGTAIGYMDVIELFLRHLKAKAETSGHASLERVVLGRPVFFVDADPRADALAQTQLSDAARRAGFRDIKFQFEPIAAAFDYESRLDREQLVLVADIGGGTSDFSLVRVGPERARHLERRDDVLGHNGVHVAGTDFDKRVELASVLRELGYQSIDSNGREVPNRIYFDLATWHLINTVYGPKRVAELQLMRHVFANPRHHARLMRTVERRFGHALATLAEEAKIAVAAGGSTDIDLDAIEEGLVSSLDEQRLIEAGAEETRRIVEAARATVAEAGVAPEAVGALYFTGGSTGLKFLSGALSQAFPQAEAVFGDRLASVATGLGIHAQRVFA